VDEEIPLREYLLVFLRMWWVILIVFVIVTGAAVAYIRLQPQLYQTQTQLLIVARVSERLTGERINPGQGNPGIISNPAVGASLSVETLRNLAKANDLLADVIRALDLRNEVTGQSMAVESLAKIMDAKAEVTQRGTQQGPVPLLTMRVRGEDPPLLKRIADKWAELFIQRNAQLFAAETARSYDFILAQYKETQGELNKLEAERAQYVGENPLALLTDELGLKRADLNQYHDTFLDLSAQFTLKSQDYSEALAHLNELSVDGKWIGLQLDANTAGKIASTLEQRPVLQARNQLFRLQEEIQSFSQVNDLTLVRQRLALKQSLIQAYTSQLEAAQNDLKVKTRLLKALETEISEQPQFLVLAKAIDDPALWQQLGLNPSGEAWERVRKIALRTEQVNPAFVALLDKIIDIRPSVETERERINLLTARVEETQNDMRSLEKVIAEKETIQLARLRNELALSQLAYDKEQAIYNSIQAQAVDLRIAVRKLQVQRDEYEKLVNLYRADVNSLSRRIASVQLKLQGSDRQIKTLESTFSELASRLQEARISKEEQASSIRVVEAAVVPQIPVGANRLRNIVLGATLGLFLGVVLAFFVHYVQGERPQAPPQGEGAKQ
jgi:uncharacterized protein involved in exopolysaccharide biosynthesis